MKKPALLFIVIVYAICGVSQNWEVAEKFTAPDANDYDKFGMVRFQNDQYLVINSPGQDYDSNGLSFVGDAGAVYLYEKSANGLWTFKRKCAAPAGYRTNYSNYGNDVLMDGKYLVIADYSSGLGGIYHSGVVFVYDTESLFPNVKILRSPDPEEYGYFGNSLAMNNGYLFIGNPGDIHDESGESELAGSGSVIMFGLDEDGLWTAKKKFIAPDRSAHAEFGYKVLSHGGKMFFSAPGFQVQNEVSNGKVYYYEYESLQLPRGWQFTTSIPNPYDDVQGLFGYDMDFDGSSLVISDPLYRYDENRQMPLDEAGIVYVFQKHPFFSSWSINAKFCARNRGEQNRFGQKLAVSGDFIAVGCRRDDTDEYGATELDNSGATYIYDHKSGDWLFRQKIVSENREIGGLFGSSVSLWNASLCVADLGTSAYDENKGALICYSYRPATGILEPTLNQQVALYPNPVSGILFVKLPSDNQFDSMHVYDITGSLILSRGVSSSTETINFYNFKPGVYLVRLISEGTTFEAKVLHQ